MNRETGLRRLAGETFDVLIVGGGATGLGCALDAASRGYAAALIEGDDFAKATSSRSTKLVHGGVRYLEQGNIALVREALLERSRLLANAPGLVRPLPFVVPAYAWTSLPYYGIGLRLYDLLAAATPFPRSRSMGAAEASHAFPALARTHLRGAIAYWDAQFDDARLAIALAQTAVDRGAAIANYVRAESFLFASGRIAGVLARDRESGATLEIRARCVVNATGIFADELRRMAAPDTAPVLAFSRGSHVVFDTDALPIGASALLVPRTSDRRVLFAIPWYGRVLAGTTDVAQTAPQLEPRADPAEIDYIIATLNRYLERPVSRADVRAVFAGVRPLVNRAAAATAKLSREHFVEVLPSGLVTICGGKWTTYRKMAQDTIDAAARTASLRPAACVTETLKLREIPEVPDLQHAIDHEMARTAEDLLARRTRALFLDARAAIAEAPAAVQLLAASLGRDRQWQHDEQRRFAASAQPYAPV